jgi:hypothetical protein
MIFIDLSEFDQSKLEYLLRKIPTSLVRVEENEDLEKRFYELSVKDKFFIACEAHHFNQKKIPSFKKCSLGVNSDFPTQEVRLDFTQTASCEELKRYLPYGKLRSSEIFYGESYSGRYKDIFSYSFDVTKNCVATFAAKE